MSQEESARWAEWAKALIRAETKNLAQHSTVESLAKATEDLIVEYVGELQDRVAELESELALLRAVKPMREDA